MAGDTSERTILFTDVQGSTELRSRLGDADADRILAAHEAIVREAIRSNHGREIAFMGDGFMAAFDSPTDGLACAVAVQQELEAMARSDPEDRVLVRIGLHHGPTAERDGSLYGGTVHAAARIEAEAAGGQVLLSETVRTLVRDRTPLSFIDRGLFWLRGFPERWRLYEVDWAIDDERRPTDRDGTVGRAPLVGRDKERADLRRAVHRARRGRGSLVLIAGEAGVGKSRLVQEIGREADARGVRVLTGHCVKMEGHAPYLPFAEMIEQAMVNPRSPAAFRRALGDAAAEIARIAPALRLVVPDLPQPVDLPPEQQRRYLWLSLLEFIERASEERPLMLVVEDLHWADESTLLLLEFLAPHLGQLPVLMVGTYRDTEVGPTHPLTRTVSELVRNRLVTRIPLRPLPRDGVAAMIEGMAGQPAPTRLVRAVHAQSEGNPFFAEEIFLHLVESGRVLDGTGRFRPDLRVDRLDVPESVRLVIGERLARLSETTRQVLAAAALVGREFEPAVVEEVVEGGGHHGPDLADAVDEATRAHLVGPGGDPARPAFEHELIRQALLADMSAFSRRRLHARTAEAIERVHAGNLDAHAADLAYHLSRAGPGIDPVRLAGHLRTAGDRAMQAAAFTEAVEHFRHATELLDATVPDARAEALERLAMALRGVGRWDESLAVMDEASAAYRTLGRADALGRLHGVMAYQLGWNARWQEAFSVASRGLEALGDAENPDRARLQAAAAWVVGLSGDHDTAAGLLGQAEELATRLGDQRALADVLHLRAIHCLGYALFADGVSSGLRAAEVFEREGALWDLTSALAFAEYHAGTIVRRGQVAPGRAAPLAERLGHLGAIFLTTADRTRWEGVFRGDPDTVEALARRQIDVCTRGGLPWLYIGHLYLGLAAHWRGDWDEAERELRRADELEAPGVIGGQSAAQLALHLAHAGRADEVRAIAERRMELLPASGRVNGIGTWNAMFHLTEALYLIGDRDRAASFAPRIQEALDMGDDWVAFDGRQVSTRAAIAAAAGRRWDEAERRYQEAFAAATTLDNRIEQADITWLRARMLTERDGPGDRAEAERLYAEAAGRYQAMGLPVPRVMAEQTR